MKAREQQYNDTEVRLRMVENAIVDMSGKFSLIEQKFESISQEFKEVRKEMLANFRWTIAAILATNTLPIILHAMKLI